MHTPFYTSTLSYGSRLAGLVAIHDTAHSPAIGWLAFMVRSCTSRIDLYGEFAFERLSLRHFVLQYRFGHRRSARRSVSYCPSL